MCICFGTPSATKMILGKFLSPKASSRCLCVLLLAVCLLPDGASARLRPCRCLNLVHTVRCEGCSRLPNNVPAGVKRLNMSGNLVTRVRFPTNVSPHLEDLTSVYLSSNDIEHLGFGDLRPLKNVMVLDLSDNNLVSIDEWSIASNVHLKRLVLDRNQQLQMVALRSQSLEHLYLRNCGLTSFDNMLLRNLPELRGLHLHGNDELPCEQVVHDLQQDYPHLKVYCDGKTTARKSISATASTETANPNYFDTKAMAHIPNFVYWDVPSDGSPSQDPDAVPQKVQLVLPVPVVPLLVILAALLIAVVIICRFRQALPCKSGHGRALLKTVDQDTEEPC